MDLQALVEEFQQVCQRFQESDSRSQAEQWLLQFRQSDEAISVCQQILC